MGYATPVTILARAYTPTDAVVVANDPDTTTTSTSWVKKKTIKLVGLITPTSLFRYKFDLRLTAGVGTAYGQLRRNGVIIGTERSTGNTAFTTYSEDLPTTDWKRNDLVELWQKAAVADSSTARNFRLCGVGSEFTAV